MKKSEIVSAVYFPFTFISPSLVELMSLCFHRVVVYHPAHSRPQKALLPWMERGFLNVRSPFEKVIDKKTLEAALANSRGWGLLHQHADMAYLKMVGNDIAPAGPETPRIVSGIRAAGAKSSKEAEGREVSIHLFLHLAREFDQYSSELREQMNRLNDQYQVLQTSFRQDEAGQVCDPIPGKLFPVREKDPGGFMIEKRMAAWNHLFQKDPAGPSLLFTDSRSALTYLLDEVDEKIEVLKLNIPYTQATLTEVLKKHPSWADHLQETFNAVLTTPWNRTLQERVLRAGREIEVEIDRWSRSTMKSHDSGVSFRCYVVPHQAAPSLLNRRCGVNSADKEDHDARVKNTLITTITKITNHHKNT